MIFSPIRWGTEESLSDPRQKFQAVDFQIVLPGLVLREHRTPLIARLAHHLQPDPTRTYPVLNLVVHWTNHSLEKPFPRYHSAVGQSKPKSHQKQKPPTRMG